MSELIPNEYNGGGGGGFNDDSSSAYSAYPDERTKMAYAQGLPHVPRRETYMNFRTTGAPPQPNKYGNMSTAPAVSILKPTSRSDLLQTARKQGVNKQNFEQLLQQLYITGWLIQELAGTINADGYLVSASAFFSSPQCLELIMRNMEALVVSSHVDEETKKRLNNCRVHLHGYFTELQSNPTAQTDFYIVCSYYMVLVFLHTCGVVNERIDQQSGVTKETSVKQFSNNLLTLFNSIPDVVKMMQAQFQQNISRGMALATAIQSTMFKIVQHMGQAFLDIMHSNGQSLFGMPDPDESRVFVDLFGRFIFIFKLDDFTIAEMNNTFKIAVQDADPKSLPGYVPLPELLQTGAKEEAAAAMQMAAEAKGQEMQHNAESEGIVTSVANALMRGGMNLAQLAFASDPNDAIVQAAAAGTGDPVNVVQNNLQLTQNYNQTSHTGVLDTNDLPRLMIEGFRELADAIRAHKMKAPIMATGLAEDPCMAAAVAEGANWLTNWTFSSFARTSSTRCFRSSWGAGARRSSGARSGARRSCPAMTTRSTGSGA